MTTPTTDPVQTDFEGEEVREKIAELIRRHVYADATGLSPAVIGCHLGGFEAAADAVIAAIRSTLEGGDQGVEAMREACAKLVETYPEQILQMYARGPNDPAGKKPLKRAGTISLSPLPTKSNTGGRT